MKELTREFNMLKLFAGFQRDMKSGKRLQKNGKKIRSGSLINYSCLGKLLLLFSEKYDFPLRIKPLTKQDEKLIKDENRYWKEFYYLFTKFLYDDLGHYDNYVGTMIKLLRSFFNYLQLEKNMNIGNFHKKFHSPAQEVDIFALSSERLALMIRNTNKLSTMPEHWKPIRHIFLFGCATGLRFSDLMALRNENIERIGKVVYLRTISKKTQTFSRVRLPDYTIEIINRYSPHLKGSIFPTYSLWYFNDCIKNIMEHYGFTEPVLKYRTKRGIPQQILKQKSNPRFCDLASSHLMRRTAITHLLRMKVPEPIVRQVSGHSPGSKDFYRYIAFSQTYMDKELMKAFDKMPAS